MTKNKRFKLAYKKDDWWAVRDSEITLWKEEVIHLLNELYEENEKLKKENKELELQLTVEKLDQHALEHYTKQNEKLQDQINALNTKIAKNEAYIKKIQHKRA